MVGVHMVQCLNVSLGCRLTLFSRQGEKACLLGDYSHASLNPGEEHGAHIIPDG